MTDRDRTLLKRLAAALLALCGAAASASVGLPLFHLALGGLAGGFVGGSISKPGLVASFGSGALLAFVVALGLLLAAVKRAASAALDYRRRAG